MIRLVGHRRNKLSIDSGNLVNFVQPRFKIELPDKGGGIGGVASDRLAAFPKAYSIVSNS
jgi:hypothetical protein